MWGNGAETKYVFLIMSPLPLLFFSPKGTALAWGHPAPHFFLLKAARQGSPMSTLCSNPGLPFLAV